MVEATGSDLWKAGGPLPTPIIPMLQFNVTAT